MIDRQEINRLVAAGDLEKAALKLGQALEGQEQLQRFALQLQQRLQGVRQRELRGTLSREDADVERARITEGLLFLAANAGAGAVTIPDELAPVFSSPAGSGRFRNRLLAAGAGLAAVLALIVYLAFLRPEAPGTFDLKAYVELADGAAGTLAGSTVKLAVGDFQTPVRPLGDDGLVIFNGLARALETQPVTLIPVGERWEVVGQSVASAADSPLNTITFQVRPLPDATIWRGVVLTEAQQRVSGIEVVVGDGLARTTSDKNGEFSVTVPLAAGAKTQVKAWKEDQLVYNRTVVISTVQPAEIIINAD